jgi:hypothetical protein
MKGIELLGKRVRLNEPYKPEEEVYKRGKEWKGFEFGIVVEIVSHETDRQLRQTLPKNVALNLFDAEGNLYLTGTRDGIPVLTFVDFHISEFLICSDNMSIAEQFFE